MNYTKILVVDDDSNIRDMLKQYLENEGYEVKTAADGYEAIDTFKKYEPDLMLLDIMLPGKSGRGRLRRRFVLRGLYRLHIAEMMGICCRIVNP